MGHSPGSSDCVMKRSFPTDNKDRFSGQLRHYHRSGYQTRRTWDEWVDGKAAQAGPTNWVKILLVVVAVLALGGIIAGLIIALR